MNDMIEYEITWAQCPASYNPLRALFVEAATQEDAREIARNHIKRTFGFSRFKIERIEETKPVPIGRVK